MFRALVRGLATIYGQVVRRVKPWVAEGLAAFSTFTPRERSRFFVLLVMFGLSAFGLLLISHDRLLVTVAAPGGNLNEGIIGYPRLINPLLAVSDADRDLTALVYSGLLRQGPNGSLIPDLAEELPTISADGLTYTIKLKPDLTWHDGQPITSADVVFTIEKALDPLIKSPKRASWEGITVQTPDNQTVIFSLKQPYSGFSDSLTLGLLPRHIWSTLTPDNFGLNNLNIEPIGSGPYKIDSIVRNDKDVPRSYRLTPFDQFSLGQPKLLSINLRFYANEEELLSALDNGEIAAGSGLTPTAISSLTLIDQKIETAALPRVFAVFLNQSQNKVLADRAVREALDISVDRTKIISEVLAGYAVPINGPLPTSVTEEVGSIAEAKAILEKAGWKLGSDNIREKKVSKKETLRLSFTLATSNNEELKAVGEKLIVTWKALGAEIKLEPYDTSDLQQNIIRPRKYEAILFGTALGRDPDLFAFWHSSQRSDPGLNIALYTNKTADGYLDDARKATSPDDKDDARQKAVAEIMKDHPAIFLYSPSFVYILPENIKTGLPEVLANPAERFLSVYRWYTNTDKIWPIFANRTYSIINQ